MVALLVTVPLACGEGEDCQAMNKVFLCGFCTCFFLLLLLLCLVLGVHALCN